MLCELVPASGSVMAKENFTLPSATPGSQPSRWAWVPEVAITVAAMAGETTMSSSGQPAAAISSPTMASSTIPAPPPPYSSGTATPRKPALPASSHSSLVFSPALALAHRYSWPYLPARAATDERNMRCSSVSAKSIGATSG